MIYHENALTNRNVNIDIRGSRRAAVMASHPMLFVDRQIRAEFGPVLIDAGLVVADDYHCTMASFHMEKLSQVSDFTKSRSPGTLTQGQKRIQLTITLGRRPDTWLQSVLQETRRSVTTMDLATSPFRFADVLHLGGMYVKTGFRPRGLGREAQ